MEPTESDDESIIGEECHIHARRQRGPRATEGLSDELDSYENLILLCRNDHKRVDDQSDAFPPERLSQLKLQHEEWVRQALSATGESQIKISISPKDFKEPLSK